MQMKTVIYGNCHLGVLSKYFELHVPELKLRKCSECNLEKFHNNDRLFAVWVPDNKNRQSDVSECVKKVVENSDLFIFQDHSGLSVIDKLQTKHLHDIAGGKKICIPDQRMLIYPICGVSLKPYIKYIYQEKKIHHAEDIIDYLSNENDQRFFDIIEDQYPINKNYRAYTHESYVRHEKEKNIYDIRIDMNDYIEENYAKKLLFETHNHPTSFYYEELIKRIFMELGLQSSISNITNLEMPKGVVDPFQFNFFNHYFKKINKPVNFSGMKLTPELLNTWIETSIL